MIWRLSKRAVRDLTNRRSLNPASVRRLWAASNRVSCSQLLNPTDHRDKVRAIGPDQEVTLYGRVQSVRKQKSWAFAHITDGSTIRPLQAILSPEQAGKLTTGTTLKIKGHWTPSPGKGQDNELRVSQVEITGPLDDPAAYPLQKKQHSAEFLRSIPHLRLRTPFNSLLARFRSECIFLLTQFFRTTLNFGPFTQVHPPVITSSDCEGAGQIFTITPRDEMIRAGSEELKEKGEHFFRNPAYLTVSTQLHLEAYAAALGNVWTLSPTFRAERSDTARHLAEFYMLEAEVQQIGSLSNLMDLVEDMVRFLVSELRSTQVGQEMLSTGSQTTDPSESLPQRWSAFVRSSRWPQIAYRDALDRLKSAHKSEPSIFTTPPTWDLGLSLEHEKWLVENVGLGSPLLVTDYPRSQKPFYMAPSMLEANEEVDQPCESEELVACFDLLLPGVAEVAGGSMREHRTERLVANMRQAGMIDTVAKGPLASEGEDAALSSSPQEPDYPHLRPNESLAQNPLKWYIDLRRYGGAPSGGFGLGFDRLIAYLAGVENVRDVVGFPRAWRRAHC